MGNTSTRSTASASNTTTRSSASMGNTSTISSASPSTSYGARTVRSAEPTLMACNAADPARDVHPYAQLGQPSSDGCGRQWLLVSGAGLATTPPKPELEDSQCGPPSSPIPPSSPPLQPHPPAPPPSFPPSLPSLPLPPVHRTRQSTS